MPDPFVHNQMVLYHVNAMLECRDSAIVFARHHVRVVHSVDGILEYWQQSPETLNPGTASLAYVDHLLRQITMVTCISGAKKI